jgi:5-methylcytosine-specific restriction enzyme subunit McrC
MFVYNLYWAAEHSILLYPKTDNQSFIHGNYARLPVIPGENQCTVGFVEVIRNNTLNPEIGLDVLKMMGVSVC